MRKQAEVPMATQDSPSLYERLGGVYSIATVVDDLIDRVMADPRLNANPLVDDAHHKVPPAGFKYLVTEMLCWGEGIFVGSVWIGWSQAGRCGPNRGDLRSFGFGPLASRKTCVCSSSSANFIQRS